MFEDKALAEEINKLILDYNSRLNASLKAVQARGTQEEFEKYRVIIGKLMGEAFTEVMTPIYSIHPDLMPEEMRLAEEKYREKRKS